MMHSMDVKVIESRMADLKAYKEAHAKDAWRLAYEGSLSKTSLCVVARSEILIRVTYALEREAYTIIYNTKGKTNFKFTYAHAPAETVATIDRLTGSRPDEPANP